MTGIQTHPGGYGVPPSDCEPGCQKGPRFVSSDLVLRAASQGLGVALARGRLARDDVANGSLVRPFGDCSLRVPDAYWIVTRITDSETDPERQAVTVLVDWLRAQAA